MLSFKSSDNTTGYICLDCNDEFPKKGGLKLIRAKENFL